MHPIKYGSIDNKIIIDTKYKSNKGYISINLNRYALKFIFTECTHKIKN